MIFGLRFQDILEVALHSKKIYDGKTIHGRISR